MESKSEKPVKKDEEIKEDIIKKETAETGKEEGKKKGGSFNSSLDRIKRVKEEQARLREMKEKEKMRKIKKKAKYAKKLSQKTGKGQPIMKNFIAHYLTKLEKGQ